MLTTRRKRTNRDRGTTTRHTLAMVYRPINGLKLDPSNPRLHSKKQIDQIAQSLQTFGFISPVVIDAQSRIVAGHGRVLAGKVLGIRDVPTICVEYLTTAQARAFAIADNRLSENSVWDERLLAQHFRDLSTVELDFDLEVTGFEAPEIDLMIEGMMPAPSGPDDPADAIPEHYSGPSISTVGDLWRLGSHRVYCGSALEDVAYAALMDDRQAVMVMTDPPYNVPIDGHASGLGRVKHKDFVMASGEMSEAEFTAFLFKACTLLKRYSVNGSLHFLHMDWRHMGELLHAGRAVYSELKNVVVWDKGTGGMGSLYRSGYELIFVFKHGKDRHRNNVQLGQFGRNRTNLWRYPGGNSFARATDEGNLLALHPTVKPVALVADAILDCSRRGDIVLDAFLGSGTTIMAAERTGRICYGLELDPGYVDTAIRRWQTWTGQTARHATSGRLFNKCEAEKEAHDAR